MKIFQYLTVAVLVVLSYSCKKETEGISKITNYITFELTGGPVVTFAKGSYAEPGYTAMEGTTDVTSEVTVDSNVNGNAVGLYSVTYSAVNAQGFPSSTERTVIIYDPTAPATDLSGTYKSNVQRVAPARTFANLVVTIEKLAPGFFHVSDFIGGFYDQGANYKYGPAYGFPGYFLLNANNTLTHLSDFSPGWASQLDNFANGTYTPATSTLFWDAYWQGGAYDFKVTLVKQ